MCDITTKIFFSFGERGRGGGFKVGQKISHSERVFLGTVLENFILERGFFFLGSVICCMYISAKKVHFRGGGVDNLSLVWMLI